MRRADLDRVVEIERESFSMPWSRGAFLYEIEQNRVARCWVCRADDMLVGYLCLWEIGGEIHITNVAVARAQRRQGIARWMLTETLEDARRRGTRTVFVLLRQRRGRVGHGSGPGRSPSGAPLLAVHPHPFARRIICGAR